MLQHLSMSSEWGDQESTRPRRSTERPYRCAFDTEAPNFWTFWNFWARPNKTNHKTLLLKFTNVMNFGHTVVPRFLREPEFPTHCSRTVCCCCCFAILSHTENHKSDHCVEWKSQNFISFLSQDEYFWQFSFFLSSIVAKDYSVEAERKGNLVNLKQARMSPVS